jgi:predicted Zn-dependent peptidase
MHNNCRNILYICLLLIASPAVAKHLDRNAIPQPAPAPVVDYGESTTFTLTNGLTVIVTENHKLPAFTCDLQLAIKPALEQERAGYKGMIGQLLQDGTHTRSKAQLADAAEQISTDLVTTDNEVAARGLAREKERILELVSDIAMNTAISPDDVERIKSQTISQLQDRRNDADAMLNNVAAALNYGPSHPFGEIITEKTVARVRTEDCTNYYTTYFRPNVAYLSIVGDVTVEQLKPLVEKYFGKWQRAEVPVTNYGHYDPPTAAHVSYIPRKNAVQSIFRVTYPIDLYPGSPYTIKARVANMILGGNNEAMLFHDLRQAHQWAYSAYSSILDNETQGSFTTYTRSRIGTDDSSLYVILDDMRRMQTGVDNNMLDKAKWAVAGSFAMSMADPANVAAYAINLYRYNMPKDYYRNYLRNVSNISLGDVTDAAAKYIQPDNVSIIIAGNMKDAAKFDKFSSNSIDFFDYDAEIIRFPYDTSHPKPLPYVTTRESLISSASGTSGNDNSPADTRGSGSVSYTTDRPSNTNGYTPQPTTPVMPTADQQSAFPATSPASFENPGLAGTATADIIRKYILAIGGESAIAGIKSIKKVSAGSITAGSAGLELTVTEIRKAPSKMVIMVEGMGTVLQKQVLNGDKGYSEVQGQKKPFNTTDADNMKAEADIQRILHPETYGINRTLKGMGSVNGSESFIVNVLDRSGKLVVEYYDVNTGYLVKKQEADVGAGGIPKTTDYSDYREVPGGNGYKIPYRTKETENKHVASSHVKTVEVNKNIADSIFN